MLMEKEIKPTNTNSGKKEGKGGREALESRSIPNNIINPLILDSIDINTPIRDPEEFLSMPALANIPIDAQPWARESINTTINNSLLLEIIAIIINVICLTLL
jgi:hypothetical protein